MDEFEDWMLKDPRAGSLSDESVGSFSWFEPLEQIISSASSSSTDSPPETQAVKTEELATLEASGPAPKKRRAPRKRLTSHQKQAHNKIEKRYRININTKIAKLQQIIPWVASEQTAFEVGESVRKGEEGLAELSSSTKLNKSMILEKAVDYILYLQNSERLYEMEVRRLRAELANATGATASSTASGPPSER
ncbi:TYE7 (YOR344C) [Zygosaccharomyces parabailii]|nr:TYE7 (YOR344C) [Zygosaccharomyces parabailii]CDH13144.1 uncharacterized protein ZBAI_04930 [Zygosaccharomyces bailii ISA1307]